MATKTRQGAPSPTHRAITIKHGSAPEIQEVNISRIKRRANHSKRSDEVLLSTEDGMEQPFYRKRPASKTMTTTKSTMTNEEDYQIEVAKLIDEDNASQVSTTQQVIEGEREDDSTDVIQISVVKEEENQTIQKTLAWKMTPKVHFPMREETPFSSPPPTESLPAFHGNFLTKTKVMDLSYLPDPMIEPPYEHRPDKSYVIHQNQPIPLNPLKAWPGYGGNLYFEPVRVESKPVYTRDGQQIVSRSRSRATSRYTLGDTGTTPDFLSESRYLSLPPSTPIHPHSRRDTPTMSYKQAIQDQPTNLSIQRKMAHLDKDFVLNMRVNPKLHEDWSWIAGLESIGTLCIGDGAEPLKKQQPKPYSRTLVVEKVPHKFTFHPGNNKFGDTDESVRPIPLVQVKIDAKKRERLPTRRYSFKRQTSARNSTQGNKLEPRSGLKRNLKLPSIPIRIKGTRVNETNFHNPWEMPKTDQPQRSTVSRANRYNHQGRSRSRIMNVLSQSRAGQFSPENKENLSFSVTGKSNNKTRNKDDIVRSDLVYKPNAFPPQSAEHETDDEDRLNYETIKSAYFRNRDAKSTAEGRRVPTSTPNN